MGEYDEEPFVLAFHGVRGSTPCCSPTVARYGGNTSCVSLETHGRDPIVFDLGTGLRNWGTDLADVDDLTVHSLVTHLHWDHVQGLPFFTPLHRADSTLRVYGPGEVDGDDPPVGMKDAFARLMAPPFFPVCCDQLPSTIEFHDVENTTFMIDDAEVMVRPVPHTGVTNGYRVTRNGRSVAYVPDHQEPIGRPDHVDPAVLELCDGVDVLIHDAQFEPAELAMRPNWGHCTAQYAVEVAAQAGARHLVLFHHDPASDDERVDRTTEAMAKLGAARGLESVTAAAEGMKLTLPPRF